MELVTERIKVSVVSYVNSYPFIYGLQNHAVTQTIDLALDNPADCAKKLMSGEVDLGLVPVAIIPLLKDANVVTKLCIGADGPVETVSLFSDVPLNEIEEVLLDYQSRTSVKLVQMLADKYWEISPKWVKASDKILSQIGGKTAAVVIGDRAFGLKNKFKYEIDLSEEWKKYTGLPFVFACWVSNKPLSTEFLEVFENALNFGLNNKATAINFFAKDNQESLVRYVERKISYNLDDKKLEAMKLFHDWLSIQS